MKDRFALAAASVVIAFAFGCASSAGPGAKAKKSHGDGGGGGVGEAEFETHDPRDLPFPVVPIGAGEPRWAVNEWSGELSDEIFGRMPKDGKPGLKAVSGHFYTVNADVRLSLAALPDGGDGLTIYVGWQYWTIAQQAAGWVFLKDGQVVPFGGPTGTLNTGLNQNLTMTVGYGEDASGRPDTFFTLQGGTVDTLRTSMRELCLLRLQEIVARAQERGHFRAIEDSEGYVYLTSLSSGTWSSSGGTDYNVNLWSPAPFTKTNWPRVSDPEFDARSVRPLASIHLAADREGSAGNAVDLAQLRQSVYGVSGAPDVVRFVKRGQAWILEGGAKWAARKRTLDALERARKLANEWGSRYLAVPAYSEAISADARCAEAFLGRGTCLLEGSPRSRPRRVVERAEADLTRAMDLRPGEYRTVQNLELRAQCRAMLGNRDGAEVDLAEVIKREPTSGHYGERSSIRAELGDPSGAAEDATARDRKQAEEKAASDTQRQQQRDAAPEKLLMEAGVGRYESEWQTSPSWLPEYAQKAELFKRRLKDLNEKQLVILLVGDKATGCESELKTNGWKTLQGKNAESEEKVDLILESTSEYAATLKNAKGREIKSFNNWGTQSWAVQRAKVWIEVLYVKGDLDWNSDRYAEILSTWDKVEQKAKENDADGALEALDALAKLDPQDKAVSARRVAFLEARQDWAGVVRELGKAIETSPDDQSLHQKHLDMARKVGDDAAALKELAWFKGKGWANDGDTAEILAKQGKFKEAAEAASKSLNAQSGSWAYDTAIRYLVLAHDDAGAQALREKRLDAVRASQFPANMFVRAGLGSWKLRGTDIDMAAETWARYYLAGWRLQDPEEPRLRVHWTGPLDMASALEQQGFDTDPFEPAVYDLKIKVTGAWNNRTAEVWLPPSQLLGTIDAGSADQIVQRLILLSLNGKLNLLTESYEKLVPLFAKYSEASRAEDMARMVPAALALADACPTKYLIQCECIDGLRRASEWEKVIVLANRLVAMDEKVRALYKERLKGRWSPPPDPLERGLNDLASVHSYLDRPFEAAADYERLAAIQKDPANSISYGIGQLKYAGDLKGAIARRKAAIEKKIGTSANDGWFELAELCRATGDELGQNEAYRSALAVPIDGWAYMSRANRRAALDDLAGAIEDATIAFEKQGSKDGSYLATRARFRLARGDADGALEDLGRSIKLSPDASVLLARSDLELKLGNAADALADRQKAWSMPPGWYALDRAWARLTFGDVDGAALDMEQYVAGQSASPSDAAQALLQMASFKLARGDKEGALASIAASLRSDETARGVVARSILHGRMGQAARATQDLKFAASVPVAPRDYWWAYDAFSRAGDWKAAFSVYERVMPTRSSRDQASMLRTRASAKRLLGDLEGAEKDIAAAIERQPQDPGLRIERSLIRQARQESVDDDLVQFEKLMALLPPVRQASHLSSRAGLALARADLDAAEKDLSQAIERDPRTLSHRQMRAGLRLRRGDETGFKADRDAIAGQLTTTCYELGTRGWTRLELGDLDGAIQDLDAAAVEANYYLTSLADALLEAGKKDDALVASERTLVFHPRDEASLRIRGLALAAKDRADDAKAIADLLVADVIPSRTAWIARGEILLACKDVEDARKALAAFDAGIATSSAAELLRARILVAAGDKKGARAAIEKGRSLLGPGEVRLWRRYAALDKEAAE
jgi:tetratricopeptide (TPR) repeat protein